MGSGIETKARQKPGTGKAKGPLARPLGGTTFKYNHPTCQGQLPAPVSRPHRLTKNIIGANPVVSSFRRGVLLILAAHPETERRSEDGNQAEANHDSVSDNHIRRHPFCSCGVEVCRSPPAIAFRGPPKIAFLPANGTIARYHWEIGLKAGGIIANGTAIGADCLDRRPPEARHAGFRAGIGLYLGRPPETNRQVIESKRKGRSPAPLG
jgi:hypothetical protein